jgi:hypothetical protein
MRMVETAQLNCVPCDSETEEELMGVGKGQNGTSSCGAVCESEK